MACFGRSLLAAMAFVMAGPLVAKAEPASPAAQAFTLGRVKLWALRDAINVVPNDASVFGVDAGAPAVAATLRAAKAPTETVTLGVDALLVRTADRLVLIDTGLGPKVGGVLIASLAKAGFRPAEVTDVLITHGHGDHVGGLIDAAGQPAFPKATIRMSAREWASLRQAAAMHALVAAVAPRVVPFQPGRAVVPGIVAIADAGHTPGHVAYEIGSGATRLIDIGDSAHSAIVSLAHPEWIIGYDGDAAAGRTARQAMLARVADAHERVFAPHFPYPGIGTIVRAGAGYAWKPGL